MTKQSRYEELYSSYHVRVKVNVSEFANALEMLNMADLWPDGALVRRYLNPKMDSRHLSICTFNCRSFKNSLPTVHNLCEQHTEHWLLPNELGL